MSLFGLDPQSIVERVKATGAPARVPALAESIVRGAIGFMVVSVAGFLPWVFAGKWNYYKPGELVMYSSCAAVFIVLSGLLLHPLLIGPGSLKRFYIFFGITFAAYAVAWIAGWMGLRGQKMDVRSIVGLFAGTAVMGASFGIAFQAWTQFFKITVALFVLNSLGYFVGQWIEVYLLQQKEFNLAGIELSGPALMAFMKVTWGVCYGIGLGAGLGYAFYQCQTEARRLLNDQPR